MIIGKAQAGGVDSVVAGIFHLTKPTSKVQHCCIHDHNKKMHN
jgi:hypothetical protein